MDTNLRATWGNGARSLEGPRAAVDRTSSSQTREAKPEVAVPRTKRGQQQDSTLAWVGENEVRSVAQLKMLHRLAPRLHEPHDVGPRPHAPTGHPPAPRRFPNPPVQR